MLDPMRDRSIQIKGLPVDDMRQLRAAATLEGLNGAQYMAIVLKEHAQELRERNGNGKQ